MHASASEWLHALRDVARRMGQPRDLQVVLDTGLTRAVLLTRADAGCLRLLNDRRELVLASSLGANEEYLREHRVLLPEDPVARAALNGVDPVRLSGAGFCPAVGGLLRGQTPHAAALVPLPAGESVGGLITLVFGSRKVLRERDRESLRTLAALLGSAIENARTYEHLQHQARTDALTGLGSRRHFDDLFRRELARARRSFRPLSLAMIDVDFMKEINDRWGHVVGDQALKYLGELLQGVRAGDVVARYGGDEFVILMPETTLTEAEAVVRRIQERVAQFNAEGQLPCLLHISIGVRQLGGTEIDLVAEADAAMYEKKRHRKRPLESRNTDEPAEEEPEADSLASEQADRGEHAASPRRVPAA